MSIPRNLSKDMLHACLYSTNNVVDRLVAIHTRAPRTNNATGDPTKIHTTSTHKKSKDEKKGETAVRRLEADMNKRTDPLLLRDARKYQKGLKEGTRSYIERLG